MTKAGIITAPRTFSTGTILYGAAGSFKAEIDSLDDARFHLKRMKAVGAFSVKSYNQPRRDQRQQVVAAARQLQMMVVPEGGSTFMHNLTMIVDGHTGIEHTLPVQTAYDDVMDLWRNTEVGYTPTLCVAYGGISGEQYWYEVDDLWLHPRLQAFTPPHILAPRARRRNKSPIEDYNHIRVAEIARQVVDQGGLVQAGGHGQLNGICTHWELWSFVQGGMTTMQALRCGSLLGAKYLGLDGDLGSIKPGKLADLIVFEEGADPTLEIRDSERIQYVMANGRMFDARRMNELGAVEPRRQFYWEQAGHGVSLSMPRVQGCGCQRPGSTAWWSDGE
jgi:imidazolonepropionase-like amidohydrolase